ncbi:ATP-binding protein [Syntrophus aciditrophicus]|uniref:Transposase n=1 Tax=Syntrophus aciditrophicus (strain SB) TaxID=56780 RepID=Q2LS33_SYNAS|nr:ATP-binding protein [Syntrophus aciditrophicus]ABC76896.1 transposase [Syntrophus aciditrophicus SB]
MIREFQLAYPVVLLCRVLNVTTSGFEQLNHDCLQDNLKRIKLTRAAKVLDTIVTHSKEDRVSHLSFLDRLLEEEVAAREKRRIETSSIISFCYEKSYAIITSNKSFIDWQELFGDPVIVSAIQDRLHHHSKVINIKGHSYRLKEHAFSKQIYNQRGDDSVNNLSS